MCKKGAGNSQPPVEFDYPLISVRSGGLPSYPDSLLMTGG
jgi:hypothetical protein